GASCYRLARGTAVAGCYVVCREEVAAPGSQRIGIIITVGLTVVVRRPSRWTRVDRKGRAVVGDDVIGQDSGCRVQCSGNVIGAARYRLACGTAIARCYVVCRQEVAAAGGQRIGIIITVGLTVVVRQIGRASWSDR